MNHNENTTELLEKIDQYEGENVELKLIVEKLEKTIEDQKTKLDKKQKEFAQKENIYKKQQDKIDIFYNITNTNNLEDLEIEIKSKLNNLENFSQSFIINNGLIDEKTQDLKQELNLMKQKYLRVQKQLDEYEEQFQYNQGNQDQKQVLQQKEQISKLNSQIQLYQDQIVEEKTKILNLEFQLNSQGKCKEDIEKIQIQKYSEQLEKEIKVLKEKLKIEQLLPQKLQSELKAKDQQISKYQRDLMKLQKINNSPQNQTSTQVTNENEEVENQVNKMMLKLSSDISNLETDLKDKNSVIFEREKQKLKDQLDDKQEQVVILIQIMYEMAAQMQIFINRSDFNQQIIQQEEVMGFTQNDLTEHIVSARNQQKNAEQYIKNEIISQKEKHMLQFNEIQKQDSDIKQKIEKRRQKMQKNIQSGCLTDRGGQGKTFFKDQKRKLSSQHEKNNSSSKKQRSEKKREINSADLNIREFKSSLYSQKFEDILKKVQQNQSEKVIIKEDILNTQ